MTYKFAVWSELYGMDWYDNFDTVQDAEDAIKSIKKNVKDGVLRFYSDVYPEDVQFDEKVEDEDEFYGLVPENDGFYFTPEGDQS